MGDDPDTLVSSSYAPLGQVEVVDGGFKLSGHWQWSSGSEHCEWALLGALVFPPEGGAPEYRTFLLPRKIMKLMTLGIQWDSKLLEVRMS